MPVTNVKFDQRRIRLERFGQALASTLSIASIDNTKAKELYQSYDTFAGEVDKETGLRYPTRLWLQWVNMNYAALLELSSEIAESPSKKWNFRHIFRAARLVAYRTKLANA